MQCSLTIKPTCIFSSCWSVCDFYSNISSCHHTMNNTSVTFKFFCTTLRLFWLLTQTHTHWHETYSWKPIMEWLWFKGGVVIFQREGQLFDVHAVHSTAHRCNVCMHVWSSRITDHLSLKPGANAHTYTDHKPRINTTGVCVHWTAVKDFHKMFSKTYQQQQWMTTTYVVVTDLHLQELNSLFNSSITNTSAEYKTVHYITSGWMFSYPTAI